MELFEQIRREYEFGIGTIAGVRKEAERASANGARGDRKRVADAAEEGGAAALEDGMRRWHSWTRFWKRTRRRRENSVTPRIGSGNGSGRRCRSVGICERTVRQYVHQRKVALGMAIHETFVPQSYDWGVEAQVDWYEAYADLSGERTKLQVFSMRSMASGAAFHCAFLHATQQAFLEAHELAFAYFDGVFQPASV